MHNFSNIGIGFLCIFLFNVLFTTVSSIEDSKYWNEDAQNQLRKILSLKNTERRAKNVVLFIGDGMGISTVTAGRIYKGQVLHKGAEEYKLSFEQFPNTGLVKTYNVNNQVTDSAASATAILSGVKINNEMVGLDARAKFSKCNKEINKISKLSTLADWAQASGLDTGFVTTTRVSHATPASLYAHANSRTWECDSKMPEDQRKCVKDIPRQLIEDAPGRYFKVIMGGAGRCLCTNTPMYCDRIDKRNLTATWQKNNPNGIVVTTKEQLLNVDVDKVEKIMGIFGYNHLDYQAYKNKETPSLANMTSQAIKLLSKNKNGFFLLVEGGLIDQAHHNNSARLALTEVIDFDDAVQTALNMLDLEESLIVVTADHSHGLTINGQQKRGGDIFGYSDESKPHDILSYALGSGFTFHRTYNNPDSVDDTYLRVENIKNRHSLNYKTFAGRLGKGKACHTGEDVGIYAIGAYSHLFRSTIEQNYIAHAIAYAACYKGKTSHCYKHSIY